MVSMETGFGIRWSRLGSRLDVDHNAGLVVTYYVCEFRQVA